MKIEKNYLEFIQSIKKQIVQSRYATAACKPRAIAPLFQHRENNFR